MANVYQHTTSARKLRGQFYTPAEFVRHILGDWPIGPADRVIDPACGDGRFLCGAIEAAATGTAAMALIDRLIGCDIDPAAVATARAKLRQVCLARFGLDVPEDRIHVYQVDALRYPALPDLLRDLGLPPLGEAERLFVIGNPPYVEAKRLDRDTKQRLTAAHPGALSGAPDLYLIFLHVCLGWLRAGDRLAFILPNKVLVNANARAARARLLADGTLAQVWFATQARIFPDAAVYPVVLFARGEGAPAVALRQIARTDAGLLPTPLGEAPHALFRQTGAQALFPLPADPVLRALLVRLLRHDGPRLGDACDIRWCVSFHRAGLREQYVRRDLPDSATRRPFLGGGAFTGNGEVTRYALRWAGWWIDYDEARLKAEGNTVPPLALFTQPKLVICQHGRTLRATYDESGVVLKDTFLCGVPSSNLLPISHHPRALAGVLNSALVHFFYAHVFYGGHVNGGYLHFLNTFLVDIPVGHWTDATATALAALVQRREHGADDALEATIERLVAAAFALTADETAALQRWLDADDNWQLRERVRPARDGSR